MHLLPPRGLYLKVPVIPEHKRPIAPEEVLERGLPPGVTEVTGPVSELFLPPQGRCNAVLRLQAERGTLRAILAGADGAERAPLLAQMASVLAAIHAVERCDWTWTEWMEASLATACRNWETGAYDPEDFSPDEPPAAVLRWLQENVPAPGAVSLLHGDYRTKNLLCQHGQVMAVIDWAFADVGDPYYDLGIALSYARPGAEREAFLGAYSLREIDLDRLRWCKRLSLFLNI